MSNLSELLPAGAGAKSASFVASGTLSNGQTVILNSDGTVSAVGVSPAGSGTPVVFESAYTRDTATTFDSNANKIVIAYRDFDNAERGTAVVGTVSGTSISFGTPVVFDSGVVNAIGITFDSNSNKVVIAYRDNSLSDIGTAVVGTVSGSSISFGTQNNYGAGDSQYNSITFDSNANKVVVAYRNHDNSGYGTARVGTVSGTSISFGSSVVFESSSVNYVSITFDSNSNKVVIAYQDEGNSDYGTAIVGTVSGTSISFGSPAVFESARSDWVSTTFDSSNNKVVIAYKDGGNSNYGTAIVGTVSGTAISFGTAVVFESANSNYISTAFDSNSNKVVVAYPDGGNSSYGTAIVGTVSGTSISFDSPVVFESSFSSEISTTFDSVSNKIVIAYRDNGNSNYGTSAVFETASTNSNDFIGITAEAISDTATGVITPKGGVNNSVSSLTTGSDYYVQDDGTISTTVSSVPAGRALSSTSILLEG